MINSKNFDKILKEIEGQNLPDKPITLEKGQSYIDYGGHYQKQNLSPDELDGKLTRDAGKTNFMPEVELANSGNSTHYMSEAKDNPNYPEPSTWQQTVLVKMVNDALAKSKN